MFWHHSFIYSTSWEDFEVDKSYMHYYHSDTVLTLTGGGCNAIHAAMSGANVHCVDFNSAQNHLLLLKLACASHSYNTLWNSFGSGDVCPPEEVFLSLPPASQTFWSNKKHYFSPTKRFYCYGGMGLLINLLRRFNWNINLQTQRQIVYRINSSRFIRFLCNFRFPLIKKSILWYICGIPRNQINLITQHDNRTLFEYLQRILNVFISIPISSNHFYFLCTHSHYTKTCCPPYLQEKNYTCVQGASQRVHTHHNTFLNALKSGLYTKVVLMDHLDWLHHDEYTAVAKALHTHVAPNGRILLRSASLKPPYISVLIDYGFSMTLINSHSTHSVCDKVNMYASTYVGIRN